MPEGVARAAGVRAKRDVHTARMASPTRHFQTARRIPLDFGHKKSKHF